MNYNEMLDEIKRRGWDQLEDANGEISLVDDCESDDSSEANDREYLIDGDEVILMRDGLRHETIWTRADVDLSFARSLQLLPADIEMLEALTSEQLAAIKRNLQVTSDRSAVDGAAQYMADRGNIYDLLCEPEPYQVDESMLGSDFAPPSMADASDYLCEVASYLSDAGYPAVAIIDSSNGAENTHEIPDDVWYQALAFADSKFEWAEAGNIYDIVRNEEK